MSPCSFCEKQNRKCVMKDGESSRCAECIRAKVVCDGASSAWDKNVPSMTAWESIEKQEAQLQQQEEEAMAKILRLRKQQRFLRERKEKMTKRGLKFLDELDAVEEKERREAEEKAAAEQRAQSENNLLANVDLSNSDDLFAAVPASFWEGLDVSGGNPSTSQG